MAIDGLGNILVAGADNAAPTDAVLARYTSGGLGVQVTGSAARFGYDVDSPRQRQHRPNVQSGAREFHRSGCE